MTNHRMRPRRSSRSLRSRLDGRTLTLTDEHALLLGRVSARAEDVLAVATEDRWPGPELRAMLGYLRTEVMRQLGDEERLLFPGQAAPPGFARLRRDHVRLRHCTEALAGAASGESGWTVERLATTSRDLLSMLERHLEAEEALLTTAYTPGLVPATAALTDRPQRSRPRTEDTVADVDVPPPTMKACGEPDA